MIPLIGIVFLYDPNIKFEITNYIISITIFTIYQSFLSALISLIIGSIFAYYLKKNSEIGIVAKDSSILNIKSYNYQNVKVPIAAYVKKREFGPAKISIFDIKPKLNNLDFISKNSMVFIEDDNISGYKSSKSINELLYGNNYGVKTER